MWTNTWRSSARRSVSGKHCTHTHIHLTVSCFNRPLPLLHVPFSKFHDKSDAELFTIDRKSDPKLLTARQQRKLVGQRPPRCFAGLENTSKVTDPIAKRNTVRSQTHYLVERTAKRAAGQLTGRDVQSAADQLNAYAEADAKKKLRAKGKDPFTKDVWTIGSLKDQRTEFKGEWIERHVTEHNLVNTGTPVAGVPKSAFHKRSQLNALPVPHPGTSYNPSLKDHQDLMAMVTDTEVKIIRKEDHLSRVTTCMFDRVTAAQRDANHLHEFTKLLHEPDDEESLDEDADNTTGYKAVNAPVVVKKKDAKARRKLREQRELRQSLADRKQEKKKITDLHRLRHLAQDVQAEDAELQVARVAKQIRKLERRAAPRRIGRNKFEEEEMDVTMPEQIAGNLRNTKTEGSILASAFKNMQRRNILAPTVDIGLRRRAEVKRFVRNSHKEEPVPMTKEQWRLNMNIKKK